MMHYTRLSYWFLIASFALANVFVQSVCVFVHVSWQIVYRRNISPSQGPTTFLNDSSSSQSQRERLKKRQTVVIC